MPTFAMFAKVTAQPGQRDAVAENLLAASRETMPGCEMYIVHAATTEPDVVYVYEVWRSEADHDASLKLETVGLS